MISIRFAFAAAVALGCQVGSPPAVADHERYDPRYYGGRQPAHRYDARYYGGSPPHVAYRACYPRTCGYLPRPFLATRSAGACRFGVPAWQGRGSGSAGWGGSHGPGFHEQGFGQHQGPGGFYGRRWTPRDYARHYQLGPHHTRRSNKR